MTDLLFDDPAHGKNDPPNSLLRVTTIQVVQAVDLGDLEKTIQSLVSRIADLPADGGKAEIEALRAENGSLKELVSQLVAKQDAIEARLDTKQDRDQASSPAAGDAIDPSAAAAELERRLTTLEERQEAAGAASGAASPELLAGLAATVAGLQQELDSKPSRAELDQKANRSELDALMQAGVGALPGTSGADGEAPALEVGADGTVNDGAMVDALNKAAADLAALRGQLLVLQDRVEGKVEQGGLDELTAQLGAMARAAEAAAAATPSVDLSSILRRLGELEARVASGAAAAPAGGGEELGGAVEAIASLADVKPVLMDLYSRVDNKADKSALEDALRRLQELAQALDASKPGAAAAPAGDDAAADGAPAAVLDPAAGPGGPAKEQQWIVSHELPSAHVQAAFDELRAQLADLAARVAAAPASQLEGGGPDLAALQGALEQLQGQVGDLGAQLAGKAGAGDLARLELALNGKADVEEVEELKAALGGKADGEALAELQMAVAGKADQSALDEIRLASAASADASPPADGADGAATDGADGASPAAGGGGGGYTNLLGAIQKMLADKATKAELAVLQAQLAGKASAEDLALLRAALDDKASAADLSSLASGREAGAEELASLDQRMGDVFAELAKIRTDLAALPADGFGGGVALGGAREGADLGGASAEGLQRLIAVLSREVGTLREGLDTVAHAANVMAVGLDGGARASNAGVAGTGGVEGRYSESGGGGGHPGSKESRSSRGGYERLIKLVGSGGYCHKMDAFDPAALQQMAQKLAYLEATMKSPAMGRIGAGGAPTTDYGIKEMERQLKRLATDVRIIKDKSVEPSPTLPRNPPGDHAMLASRPIVGYRCMACDRPLDQLDVLPGPHIPTQQLPARAAPPVMEVPTRGIKSGRAEALSPQSSAQRQQQNMNNDPNVRGVQNWYKDEKGMAAEALPRDHVGPHLPPGGWRPSNPGTVPSKQTASGGPGLPVLNGIRKGTPSTADEFQRATPPGLPVEGTPANVMLPQIS